jgi:arsenate reductase
MAEGFANFYGSDVLIAASAGLSPMPAIVQETVDAMAEVGIDITGHSPAWYEPALAKRYDIVVNMSGYRLPGQLTNQLVEWQVPDPFMKPMSTYRKVRDGLEHSVMQLIIQLRREAKAD